MGLRLSSFPNAESLDGTELVGLVQGGETVKAQVNDIAIIAKGPPGSAGEGYPTRIALSDVIATDRDDAYLAEPGREGKFVFSTADLSAQVASDTQQGLYVAPASDATGAAGAWVRKYTGRKDVRWFGAKLDGVTDDSVALQAWLDSGGALYIPEGDSFSSATLIIRRHVNLDGGGYGFDARLVNGTPTVGYELQPGARIRFPAGVGGFDVQPQTTVTDVATGITAGVAGYTQEGAGRSRLRNLALVGAGTGALATGLHCRTLIDLENVSVRKFQGKGFDISASSDFSDGNSEFGSASLSALRDCSAISCGSHGLHIRGRDANACTILNFNAQLCGGWGILDESLLGNTYVGGQAATNTLGSYKCIGGVANSQFIGCYAETGTGQAPDLSFRCSVIGGLLADSTDQLNVGTNGNPTITHGGGVRTFQTTYDRAQPVLGALSAKAAIYRGADRGLTLQGAPDVGGTYDLTIADKSDQPVVGIVSGTAIARFFGPIQPLSNYIYFNGSTTDPGIAAGDSVVFSHATNGVTLSGWGSALDTNLANHNGTPVVGVPTGTNVMSLATNTVAALPASPPVGSRSFVTDATATTFASAVASGGANKVPVYFDGAWKIG